MTTDPLIRPEGVYVGATEGATRYQEDTMTGPQHLDPEPAPLIPPIPVPDAGRRILRTLVQIGLGRLTAALVLAVPELREVLTEDLQAWAVTAASEVLAVALAVGWAWLMTRPTVNAVLTKLGLGAQPRS